MEILYIIRIVLGLLLFPAICILFITLAIAKTRKDDGLLFIDFKNASRDSKTILFTILGFIIQYIVKFPKDPTQISRLKEVTKWYGLIGYGFMVY